MKNSNTKILTIAVVLLLLTNIALVVFMMKGKKRDGERYSGKGEPYEQMVKELDMTDQQQKDYKLQKEEHLKTIKPLFDSVRAAKTAFFALIKDPAAGDSLVAVYGQRIAEKQAAIDLLTFAHFKRVRNLFTPEQQPKFDTFIQKMMQRGRRDSAGKKDR
ncbi:MAG: Spy/CpxP family protein refolding chaperone [Chitinophagaceae bacterium]